MSIESNKQRRVRRRAARVALLKKYVAQGMTESQALDELDKVNLGGAHPETVGRLLAP